MERVLIHRIAKKYAIERLENRTLLAGVTLITHGYQIASFPQWVDTMAHAITQRLGIAGTDYSLYKAVVGGSTSNPTVLSFQRLAGPPNISTRYEIVIELDWSTFASSTSPGTAAIADVV